MAGTVQLMDEPVCLDDRGFRNVTATQRFGDFSIATISEQIRPLLDRKREGGILPVTSVRIRRKSQYRIWFNDGDCIVIGYVRRGRSTRTWNTHVRSSTSGQTDATGSDRYWYCEPCVLGRGQRWQGTCLRDHARVRLRVRARPRSRHSTGTQSRATFGCAYNDFKSPHLVKRYRKLLLEVDSVFRASFSTGGRFR